MQQRRLAAIMFTDIVGYTKLMASSEKKAFEILRKNRNIQRPLVEKYNGEWLKEIGDGILASFHSTSDAVRCADEIQRSTKKADIPLRIGLHEGEVVFEGGDVLGDGVNVASRLEELAEEGCIYVSGTVYNDIRNKEGIHAEFISEEVLKNVEDPVKIYRVTCEESQPETLRPVTAESEKIEKKSIIVLPFVNMSPDPDQEYFSDGLTEEIITDLSQIHDLLVISRSSAMTFKGTNKKVREIAAEVNVHYVLEGSVRKSGNNLRITAQLIDSENDEHLWAEKYSGTLDDVFDIQEKVSCAIVGSLKLKFSGEEKSRLAEHPIDNPLAFEYYLKARKEHLKMTKEGLDNALRYLQKGIEVMGENVLLLAGIGYAYYEYLNLGIWLEDEKFELVENYAHKIFELEPDSPYGHLILGLLKIWWKDPKEAIMHFKKVLNYNPNDFDAILWSSAVYANIGKKKIAYSLANRLMDLDPLNSWAHWLPGFIQIWDGQFEIALDTLERFCHAYPDNIFGRWMLALCFAFTYNFRKASSIFKELGQEMPGYPFAELGLKFKAVFEGKRMEVLNWKNSEHKIWAWRDFQLSYYVCQVLSLAEAKDEALKWLEHAINIGMINYPFIAEHDPLIENIRGEPQFKKLEVRIKHEWESFEF